MIFQRITLALFGEGRTAKSRLKRRAHLLVVVNSRYIGTYHAYILVEQNQIEDMTHEERVRKMDRRKKAVKANNEQAKATT